MRGSFATGLPLVGVVAMVASCSSNGSDHASTRAEAASRTPAPASAYAAGALVQADSLGNTVIGGPDRGSLTFRFRAAWTGSVTAIRCYVIKNVNGRTGYSLGDGGTMRVAMQAPVASRTSRSAGC